LQNNQLSKRYAAALFEISRERGIIENIFNDFNNFVNFCFDKLCLKEFLSQTYIGKEERFEVIDLLSKELSFNEYFTNFLHILIEQERTGYLPKIFSDYSVLRDSFLNISKISVISAKNLKPEEENKIKNIIEKAINKTVVISAEVDEKIIGGYIINIDNVLYDASIKTQADNFYNYLKQGAFIYGN
jgi:F-type H+-transporting ATPase subunit delta